MHPTRLPQDEAPDAREARRQRVAARRERYRYDHGRLAPFAVASEVPAEERYSVEYHAAMIQGVVATAENLAHAPIGDPGASPESPAEYAHLFTTLPRPDAFLRHRWKDWFFGEQRLAGVNPLVLRAVSGAAGLAALQDKMPVTDHHLRAAVMASGLPAGRESLAAAAEDGHLLVADYELLAGLPRGHWVGGPKYLTAPIALFTWRGTGQGDAGELVPLAIQLAQDPGESAPIFTPAHEAEWPLAKLFVQVADANHHEMASHLAGTHLVVEPFAVATGRHLAQEHPVSQLLAPHLRFTLARNREAQLRLINPDGPVDELLASSLAGSLEIARRARRGHGATPAWDLAAHAFDAALEARGLEDPDRLPHFPFRDDGRLLWDALGRYVEAAIATAYPTAKHLAEDEELQAWARDLASPEGGAVPGMPAPLETPAALARVLQTLLFTAGPLHAATNYPQYDAMGFVANMPLAAYLPPPDSCGAGKYDAAYLAATLPPMGQGAKQLVTVYNLSAYRHDRLGHFGDLPEVDAAAAAALRRDLATAEEVIRSRNRRRRFSYEYLRPSLVPNSISV